MTDEIVTDYAIVQWLEHVAGVDLEPVREEIRRIIAQHAIVTEPIARRNHITVTTLGQKVSKDFHTAFAEGCVQTTKEVGRIGGLARAARLSPERRSEIARAARKRWNTPKID